MKAQDVLCYSAAISLGLIVHGAGIEVLSPSWWMFLIPMILYTVAVAVAERK